MSAVWVRQAQYEVRSAINRSPVLFALLSKIQPQYRAVLVSPKTDILVEGFPRSGNTFAVVALQLAQDRPLRIARHTHAPAQIALATRHGTPALVLVRKPVDAVVSMLIREPSLTPAQLLRSYSLFYSNTYRWRQSIVVSTFDQVITAFGEVVSRLNETFLTAFSPFDHSKENVHQCFAAIEQMESKESGEGPRETHVARPSSYREELRNSILPLVLGEEALLEKATAVYLKFSQLAEGKV